MSGIWIGSRVTASWPTAPSPRAGASSRSSADWPSSALSVARAELNSSARLVVLEDRAAVRARELDGAADDRGEDGVEIERGADGAPDVAERGELIDGARELVRARLQLGQQARVLDRDHRLIGEGLEERDLVVGEPAGLAAGQPDRPDRLVVTEQRHPTASVATDTGEMRARLRAIGDRSGRRRC